MINLLIIFLLIISHDIKGKRCPYTSAYTAVFEHFICPTIAGEKQLIVPLSLIESIGIPIHGIGGDKERFTSLQDKSL